MPSATEQDIIDTINGNIDNPVVVETPLTPEPTEQPNTEGIAPVETPEAVPAQQAAQPTETFDEELLKIGDGTLKSKEDLVALLERSKQLTELETRVNAYETENTSLKAQVNTEVFATPFLKGLNDLYKANASEAQINAYTTLNKVNLEELPPLEVRKLALQSKNGLTPDEATDYLNSHYKLDPDENDDATIRTAQINLKIDAKADLEYLQTQKADSAIAPNVKEEQAAQIKQAEHLEKLQPIAQNVINGLSFKGLSINGKNGADAAVADFDISEDSKKGLQARMEGYLQQYGSNIPANEEGTKQIREFAENVLVLHNWKNWLINSASVREVQVRAEYTNPSSISRGVDNPDKGKTDKEELGKFILDNALY